MNSEPAKKGYIYILVNPAFTGFVKIGKTTASPEERARKLSSATGVPAPFAVAWDVFVCDCHHVERLIHQRLAPTRSRNDREFFSTSLRNAIAIAAEIATPFVLNEEALPQPIISSASVTFPTQKTEDPSWPMCKRYQKEIVTVSEDPAMIAKKHLDMVNSSSTLATIRSIQSILRSTSRAEFLVDTMAIYKSLPEWPIDTYGKKVGEKKATVVAVGRAYVAIRAMLHNRFNIDMTEKSPEQIKNDRIEKFLRNHRIPD